MECQFFAKLPHWNVSNNKLECIDGDLEKVFENVYILQMQGNPWKEECLEKINNITKIKN